MTSESAFYRGSPAFRWNSRGSMRVFVAVTALFGALGFFRRDIFESSNSRFAPCVEELESNGSTENFPHDEASIPEEFSRTWPDVKRALCPNMVPNTSLGYTLFELARKEVGLKSWNQGNHAPREENLFRSFYEVHQGAFLYISPGKQPTLYMDVWKCAHDQIQGWAKNTLKRLHGEFTEVNPENVTFSLETLKERNLLDQTCVVTAIRDPVSHFLSGYNEIEFRNMREPARLDDAPGLLFPRYQEGSQERFKQFVDDLLTGPVEGSWLHTFHREQIDHLYSMSAVLHVLALTGAKMSSYLPSLNNLQEEWPKYIQKTCPGLPERVTEPMHLVRQHESKKDEHGFYQASKSVWSDGGPTAKAICALHALDYACWEELPEGVPAVCQDVYSAPHFVEAITT